jgi:hypothetical protein
MLERIGAERVAVAVAVLDELRAALAHATPSPTDEAP